MGHLLSRAFRRLTQGNQARNPLPEPANDQNNDGRADRPQFVRTTIESIPVGESLDSSDYPGIENRSSRTKNDEINADDGPKELQEKTIVITDDNNNDDKYNDSNNNVTNRNPKTPNSIEDIDVARVVGQVPAEPEEAAAMVAKAAATITDENSKPQDVEEAVIKIQAYVRGHLTRKALKGAHQQQQQQQQKQQQNSPNAIGQRQFDEDSLIRNPPSAVFSPSSPLNAVSSSTEQQQKVSITRAPLESIAEVSEGSITAPTAAVAASQQQQQQSASDRRSSLANSRKRLSPIPITQNDDPNRPRSPGSVSSETGASIDLGFCATPSSVSIDIADHNIIPTDKLATVLHHRERDSIAAESASETLHEIHAPSSTVSAADIVPVDVPAPGTSAATTTSEKHELGGSSSSGVPRLEFDQPAANSQEIRNEPTIQMAATTSLHQNGQAKASSADPLLDTEQAAAIRIQSAFRGYRSRKNSPYRSRSPHNSSGSSTLPHNNNDNNHNNNNNNNNSINHHDSIQVALDKN